MRKYQKMRRQKSVLNVTEIKKSLGASKVIKIVRNTIEFQCGVCKTLYSERKDAQKCEKRLHEKIIFKKGDKVKNVSYLCQCDWPNKTPFFAEGVIVKRVGPELMDEEYCNKWLGGRSHGMHVYRYIMSYKCLCGRTREDMLYSVELEKIAD